jgi:sugar transferase (PEP-CTERM/EpsH1 system associated)
MANILFLPHRMPYPPDKGDKVRSYNLLRHLVRRHRVFVGTFVDDPADRAHLPALRALCAGLHVQDLNPLRARAGSAMALLDGGSLSERCFRSAALSQWAMRTVQDERIDLVLAFSSTMAPYAMAVRERFGVPFLLDMVDVDSAKWAAYADSRRWPLSWLYRREAGSLLALERRAAMSSHACFLATESEAALLARRAPETAPRLLAMPNGVDSRYWSCDADRPSPYGPGERALVFTGAMDYWPNVDAVAWFATEMLPVLRQTFDGLRLHIVGRNPTAAVRALASECVVVTGTVPDVRPWLQHAEAVVAPLRLARGIQNKVLEAMAMARPVVAAQPCVEVLSARPGLEILSASLAREYVAAIATLLNDRQAAAEIGRMARERVLTDYAWEAQLALLDERIEAARQAPGAAFALPARLAAGVSQ